MTDMAADTQATRQQLMESYPHSLRHNQEPSDEALLIAALGTLHHSADIDRTLIQRLNDANADTFDKVIPSELSCALLNWVDEAFRNALNEASLDDQLAAEIQLLPPLVAAVAIREDTFLQIGSHPLQQLLDDIFSQAIGWHQGLGRSGEALLAQIQSTCAQARKYFTTQEQSFAELLADFQVFLAQEEANAERLRARVIESETGRLKAASARLTAARELNEIMQGKQFPPVVSTFLQATWFDSLQLILILHGVESREWERAIIISKTLVWSVQPFDQRDEEHRQRLYKTIPKIPREVSQLLLSLQSDPDARQAVLAAVEDTHFQILRNRPPPYLAFEPIELDGRTTRSRVSQQMLAQVEALQIGQWFLIRQDDKKDLRVRLALKLEEYEQLLFVNRTGAKALHKSFEDFAYLLSSGTAILQQPLKLFSNGLQRATQAGSATAPDQAQQPAPVVPLPEVFAEPALSVETTPAEPTLDIPGLEPETTASAMAIGTWVLFKDAGEPRLCKLAARITGRDWYLFVNQQGKRERELCGAELAALESAGHLQRVGDASQFEATVTALVRNLTQVSAEESDDE